MSRPLLTFALLLSFAPAIRADDGVAKTVADLAAQLGLEEVEKRDAAFSALVRLGLRAESVVRAEMSRATDPEVRGRLLAVLQMYSLEEEEVWAIGQLRKGDPFPRSKEGCDRIDIAGPAPIADLVEIVRHKSGVKIELYTGDTGLADFVAGASYPAGTSTSCTGPDAAENMLWNVLCAADVASVVDGDRVVIVRLTPGFLFERLGRELDRGGLYWIASQLKDFDSGRFNFWHSAQRFLQLKGKEGGPGRTLWFELLKSRALDRTESERNRSMALLGLSKYLGASEDAHPDVDEVFSRLVREPESPAAVRRWAVRGLTWGTTDGAQDLVLDILAGKDEPLQRDLVDAMLDATNFGWNALSKIGENPDRLARLKKSLSELSASKSPALSLHATVLRAWRKDPEALAALAEAHEPSDPAVRIYFLHSLFLAKTPAARDRFLEFRSNPEPGVRAAVCAILGTYAGGKGRGPDAAALLDLLSDPAPIVRNFAAAGLGTIYGATASEPFTEGQERAVARLKALAEVEKDPRVKESVEAAIKKADW
ncbi:MAG: hypothetical protein FD180_2285 [Planctomycetota bacterium]|nr:MAG: hypothetical protein FD180_2285 [Planctomycetota bacterium]